MVDLDFSPDPIRDGQHVDRFPVRLRADGSGECETRVDIRDSDHIVVTTETYRLRPEINTITLTPNRGYRCEREDLCFQVVADIERTSRRLDAQRRFCATRAGRGRWTLRN